MVALWNTATKPKALTTETYDVSGPKLIQGVDTALTHYYGDADPSNGASWGANELGVLWWDTGIDSDASENNPILKVWDNTDGAGTYGWRRLDYRRIDLFADPLDLTSLLSSPYTTDDESPGDDLDLSTLLNTVQTHNSKIVVAIHLSLIIEESGTISGNEPYFGIGPKKSSGQWWEKVYAQVSGIPRDQRFWIQLGTGANAETLNVIRKVATSLAVSRFHAIGLMEAY